jgi:hypothetical protein
MPSIGQWYFLQQKWREPGHIVRPLAPFLGLDPYPTVEVA